MASATILLVDDDEVLRHTLATVLQHHGYDVTAAASVPEALKLISVHRASTLLPELAGHSRDGLVVPIDGYGFAVQYGAAGVSFLPAPQEAFGLTTGRTGAVRHCFPFHRGPVPLGWTSHYSSGRP